MYSACGSELLTCLVDYVKINLYQKLLFQDLHALLADLADSQMKAKGLARGSEGTEQERAIILAGLRRQLSMASAKAYSACLLDRVARVGEEHRLAAKRRAWLKSEEERMEEERKAFWNAHVRAKGLTRVISASADVGPRSRVRACGTLRLAPHRH